MCSDAASALFSSTIYHSEFGLSNAGSRWTAYGYRTPTPPISATSPRPQPWSVTSPHPPSPKERPAPAHGEVPPKISRNPPDQAQRKRSRLTYCRLHDLVRCRQWQALSASHNLTVAQGACRASSTRHRAHLSTPIFPAFTEITSFHRGTGRQPQPVMFLTDQRASLLVPSAPGRTT